MITELARQVQKGRYLCPNGSHFAIFDAHCATGAPPH